jgi:hypothetical protein
VGFELGGFVLDTFPYVVAFDVKTVSFFQVIDFHQRESSILEGTSVSRGTRSCMLLKGLSVAVEATDASIS